MPLVSSPDWVRRFAFIFGVFLLTSTSSLFLLAARWTNDIRIESQFESRSLEIRAVEARQTQDNSNGNGFNFTGPNYVRMAFHGCKCTTQA